MINTFLVYLKDRNKTVVYLEFIGLEDTSFPALPSSAESVAERGPTVGNTVGA